MLYNVYVVDLCSDKRPATGGKAVKNYSSHRFAKLTLARAYICARILAAWASVPSGAPCLTPPQQRETGTERS